MSWTVAQAQNARLKLHRSWTQYIDESVKLWRTFATDFANKDAELAKKVTEAKEAVQKAKKKYDTEKEDNDRQDAANIEDVEEISDGMEDEPTDKMATAEEIQANINKMVDNLEVLRARPAQEQSEHANKKQRTDPGDDGELPGQHGFGASALKPFGAPGK